MYSFPADSPPLLPLSTLPPCTTSTDPIPTVPPLSSLLLLWVLCHLLRSAIIELVGTVLAFFPSRLRSGALFLAVNWNAVLFRWGIVFFLLLVLLLVHQNCFLHFSILIIDFPPSSISHAECPIEHSLSYRTSESLNSPTTIPYFAAWLIRCLISLAPSSILQTGCPRWSPNIMQPGQTKLHKAAKYQWHWVQ